MLPERTEKLSSEKGKHARPQRPVPWAEAGTELSLINGTLWCPQRPEGQLTWEAKGQTLPVSLQRVHSRDRRAPGCGESGQGNNPYGVHNPRPN